MPQLSGITWPWLRRIKVTFDGLSGNRKAIFQSDGTQNNIRITANVRKTLQSMPAATNLMIYNLDSDTRGSFQRTKTKVTIEAGWDNGPFAGLSECFKGSIVTAFSQRAGADIVTNINSMSCIDDLVVVTIDKTWARNESVASIVNELADMLPGVKRKMISGFADRKIADGGWTYSGTVKNALGYLSNEFGFSWTIVDDCFQAIRDQTGFANNVIIREPFLRDVNPVFQGAGLLQTARGLRIRCAFNPNVLPMFNVRVESQIEPKFNGGVYIVQNVDHALDCFSGDSFTTTINTIIDSESGTINLINQ